MRIAIVGGRGRYDKNLIFKILDEHIGKDDTIISGGAIGVDKFAEEYAINHGLKKEIFYPTSYRPIDYVNRNREIAKRCEKMLAFPSKDSKGTWITVNFAREMGKEVLIFEYDKSR